MFSNYRNVFLTTTYLFQGTNLHSTDFTNYCQRLKDGSGSADTMFDGPASSSAEGFIWMHNGDITELTQIGAKRIADRKDLSQMATVALSFDKGRNKVREFI